MPRQPVVEIDETPAGARLARVAALLESPAAAMDEIGRHLVASTLRRFEAERAPDGKPWLRSARAVSEGGRTLTETGRLRRSLTHVVGAGGRAVTVGSDLAYAAVHQFGRAGGARSTGAAGRGRRTSMPARPFLGIDAGDREALRTVLARALREAAS